MNQELATQDSAEQQQRKSTNTEVKEAREFNYALLALQFGALLLAPSISNIIEPPFSMRWLLLTYYGLAIISIFMLGISYFITYTQLPKPVRIQGLGTNFVLLSMLMFVAFFAVNLWQDTKQLPQIESIEVSNLNPRVGELVKLSVKAKGRRTEGVDIKWLVDGKVSSSRPFLFIRGAEDKPVVSIAVIVGNDAGETQESILLDFLVSEKDLNNDKSDN